MIFPTLGQVRGKSPNTSSRIIRHYNLTENEEAKIDAMLQNKKSILHIDTLQSYEKSLLLLDSIFGKFIEISGSQVIIRGKLEFKEVAKNEKTMEQEYVYTISDPKSLYRKNGSNPLPVRIPAKANIPSGIYVQLTAKPNSRNNQSFIIQPEDVEEINFEAQIPSIFLDYSNIHETFKDDYAFDMSETNQWYKRNLQLSNFDLMMINKIAGENFHNDVRGGVNFNIIKYSHGQNMYNLEVLDEFLDAITIGMNSTTVFNRNMIHSGNITDFATTLNKSRRSLLTSSYKNYYGCNIGFSLGKLSHSDEDKIIEKLGNTNVDYINPVGKIITASQSAVRNMLKNDKELIYSSKILFLQTQLLSMKSEVKNLIGQQPKILRMASMLKKFENCIYRLGNDDEILPSLSISGSDIKVAKRFVEENKKEVVNFISHR